MPASSPPRRGSLAAGAGDAGVGVIDPTSRAGRGARDRAHPAASPLASSPATGVVGDGPLPGTPPAPPPRAPAAAVRRRAPTTTRAGTETTPCDAWRAANRNWPAILAGSS